MAADMVGKQIMTVENDRKWFDYMVRYFASAKPPSQPLMHHAYIGETGAWGKPKDSSAWEMFHQYPLAIWDRPEFKDPDVVLIDGRLRVACFVTTFLRIKKPTIVLFDDYVDRHDYHVVERLAKPTKIIGRMARFDLMPSDLPREELTWMVGSYNKVRYHGI